MTSARAAAPRGDNKSKSEVVAFNVGIVRIAERTVGEARRIAVDARATAGRGGSKDG